MMRDYDVTLHVTGTVTVTVRAESVDAACEQADTLVSQDLDTHDWAFDSATLSVEKCEA